jgi:hypothetical protein
MLTDDKPEPDNSEEIMKTKATQFIMVSAVGILFSGCYTQLEVVERPVASYDRYDRFETARAYNVADEQRLEAYTDENADFDVQSYEVGYEDGFSDLELHFRDYSRSGSALRNDYALGYREGYQDASWDFHRSRYRYRYVNPYYDPFFYDSYWAFHMSWSWNRPWGWHYGFHYGYSPYYSYNPYYNSYYPYSYWHRPYHGNRWIVYNNTIINNDPVTTVNRGPRNSGINRDRNLAGNESPRTNTRNVRSVTTDDQRGRVSGTSRGTPATLGREGSSATTPARSTSTGRTTTNTGRSSGVQNSGERQREGSGTARPAGNERQREGSGTARPAGNERQRSGSGSGTVNQGSRNNSGSGRPASSTRNDNDISMRSTLPAVTPSTPSPRNVVRTATTPAPGTVQAAPQPIRPARASQSNSNVRETRYGQSPSEPGRTASNPTQYTPVRSYQPGAGVRNMPASAPAQPSASTAPASTTAPARSTAVTRQAPAAPSSSDNTVRSSGSDSRSSSSATRTSRPRN